MIDSLTLVLPLAAFFILGYAFRMGLRIPLSSGQILTQIIFHLTLPAVVFLSFLGGIGQLGSALLMPLLAIGINLSLYLINRPVTARLLIHESARPVFGTAPLITNIMLFLSPYIYLTYGPEGLIRLSLYDAGNALTCYILAQPLMAAGSGKQVTVSDGFRAISRSFPMWALLLGLGAGALQLQLPGMALKSLEILRDANAFLPMFVLGFYFSPATEDARHIALLIFIKMGLGLGLGCLLSFLFSNPLDKMILILASGAPLGALSLILASLYGRDTRFAAGAVSYSIVVGTLMLPLLDWAFRWAGFRW